MDDAIMPSAGVAVLHADSTDLPDDAFERGAALDPVEDTAMTAVNAPGAAQDAAEPPAAEPVETGAPSLTSVLEALLFSSDVPLSAARLAELAGGTTPRRVRDKIEALDARLEQAGLTFRIEEIAGGYQMMTLPVFRPWLARLHAQRSQSRLTDAALETLAIIAYKQPLIRADIESIRGVACGDVVNRLREMGLVRIVGRAEVVGRPLLYGTTRKFLDVFGLAGLDDLPAIEALKIRPGAAAPPAEGDTRAVAGA